MPWPGIFRRKRREKPMVQGRPAERFTACTFCGQDSFYEGPSGGASQNITCSNCGARFNIGLIPGGPVLLDTLSGPTKEKP